MMTKADRQIFYGLFFRSGEIKAVYAPKRLLGNGFLRLEALP
jgi:hypothetical protein